jgi:hypothetical protein
MPSSAEVNRFLRRCKNITRERSLVRNSLGLLAAGFCVVFVVAGASMLAQNATPLPPPVTFTAEQHHFSCATC